MASLSQLIVKISAESSDFDRGIAQAQRSALKFSEQLNSIGSTLLKNFTLPLGALGAAATKSFADIDSLRRGLEAVTGSAAEASRQMTQLREVAKLPGLGFKEAVQGAVNLQAVGFSAKQSQAILLQFGNALATVGRGREDLNEVIRQLGQLASRGKVTADNLKPIIERVPQVAAIIKREFGTIDTEQLQKLGVSSEQFINVLLKGLGELPRATGGIKNDLENLRDQLDQTLGKLGEAIAPGVRSALAAVDPLLVAIGKLATGFSALPGPAQTASLAIAGIAIAAGPITKIVGSISELSIIIGKLAGEAGKLPAWLVARLGGAAAATAVGVGSLGVALGAGAVLVTLSNLEKLEKQYDAAMKAAETSGSRQAAAMNAASEASQKLTAGFRELNVFDLRARAQENSAALQTFGVEVGNLGLKIDTTAARLREFGGIRVVGIENSADALKSALANLNVKGAKEQSDALAKLKKDLDTVRSAYRAGDTDLGTLNRATAAYNEELKKLGVTVNSFRRATIPNLIEVEQFNRQQTALQGAVKAITDFANAGREFGVKLATSTAPVETFTTQLELLGRNSPEAANRVTAALQELSAVRLPVENLNAYRAAVDMRELLSAVTAPLTPLNRALLDEADAAIAAGAGTLEFARRLDAARSAAAQTAVETEILAQNLERVGRVKATTVEIDPKLDTRLNGSFLAVEQNMRRLGLTATTELRRQADVLGQALERAVQAKDAGTGSQQDVDAIRSAYEKASVAAAGLTTVVRAQQKSFAELKTTVKQIIGGFSSDLARSIVEWRGLGDAVKGVMKDISANIITFGINSGLRLLGNELAKVSGIVGSLGRGLQDIFGTAGRTAGAVAQGAGGGAGAAGSTAATIGTAALGGLAGAVTAVSSVVTAVFAGLQFFQGRRMEQDIGRIEVTTRGELSQLISIQGTLNQWMPYLKNTVLLEDIRDGIGKIYIGLSQINFSGSSGGINQQTVRVLTDFQDEINGLRDVTRDTRVEFVNMGSAVATTTEKHRSLFSQLTNFGGALDLLANGLSSVAKIPSFGLNPLGAIAGIFGGNRSEADLSRVEVSTRGALSQLISIQGSLNQWLPFLNRLPEASFARPVDSPTFSNCSFTFQLAPGTPEEVLRQVARHLKLRDRAFSGA